MDDRTRNVAVALILVLVTVGVATQVQLQQSTSFEVTDKTYSVDTGNVYHYYLITDSTMYETTMRIYGGVPVGAACNAQMYTTVISQYPMVTNVSCTVGEP